jgi:hypothetical protein
LYNLNVPVGSWIGTFKIDNEEVREKFRKGELRAVSIEGLFEHLDKSSPERLQSAILSDMWNKHINELSEVEAGVVLSKILETLEQPSITSTYPGEVASGSISPALLVEAPNLDVLGYETSYFQICPLAQKTFSTLIELPLEEDTIGMVRSAAVIADRVFEIEAGVLEEERASDFDVKVASVLIKDFKDIIDEIGEEVGVSFDVSYMDDHLKTIKSYI